MTTPLPFDTTEFERMTQAIIMYPHLGGAERLFGGQLLSWIDEAGALAAMRVMKTQRVVTKKISEVIFETPGLLGDVVEVWCKPTRLGTTSITIDCRMVVLRERDGTTTTFQISHCELVYVSLDEAGIPCAWNPKNP